MVCGRQENVADPEIRQNGQKAGGILPVLEQN